MPSAEDFLALVHGVGQYDTEKPQQPGVDERKVAFKSSCKTAKTVVLKVVSNVGEGSKYGSKDDVGMNKASY